MSDPRTDFERRVVEDAERAAPLARLAKEDAAHRDQIVNVDPAGRTKAREHLGDPFVTKFFARDDPRAERFLLNVQEGRHSTRMTPAAEQLLVQEYHRLKWYQAEGRTQFTIEDLASHYRCHIRHVLYCVARADAGVVHAFDPDDNPPAWSRVHEREMNDLMQLAETANMSTLARKLRSSEFSNDLALTVNLLRRRFKTIYDEMLAKGFDPKLTVHDAMEEYRSVEKERRYRKRRKRSVAEVVSRPPTLDADTEAKLRYKRAKRNQKHANKKRTKFDPNASDLKGDGIALPLKSKRTWTHRSARQRLLDRLEDDPDLAETLEKRFLFKKPVGRPPKGKEWNPHTGVWEDVYANSADDGSMDSASS